MTYEELTSELKLAGLSGRELARLLKLNPNTIANYKRSDAVPSHLAVIVTLMREMKFHGLDFLAPLEKLEIERKAPRGSSSGIHRKPL